MGNSGVDTGHILQGAIHAPGDQSHDVPLPRECLAHERGASVTVTGVLTLLSPGADLALVQAEFGGPVLAPLGELVPQDGVAPVAVIEWQVYLVHDVLEVAVDPVLSPAGGPAANTGSIPD